MRKLFFLCLSFLFYNAISAQADTSLNEYKGTYTFPPGSATESVEISIVDGTLFANSSLGSAAFSKMSKDTFSIPSYGGMAYFFRNKDGKVDRIRVEVQNIILEGPKEVNLPVALRYRRERFLISR